jgi:septal ring factor EnvC (AmiA/AmiB activator)
MTTLAIKENSTSSKSLFPDLNKHTCLMAKENKKMVNVKNSSPQCTSSDDNSSNDECDESFDLGKNPTKRLDNLMKQINLRDELLESQEELLEKERENTSELKKLLALKKEKSEKLEQELIKSKETTSNLKSSIGAFQETHDVL